MKRIFAALLLICFLLCACGEKPAQPEKLSATLENGAVVIRWEQSGEAETYRLYRRAPKEKDYKFIFDSDSDETSYTDRFIQIGGTYLYKLEIIGKNGVSEALESSLNVPVGKQEGEVAEPELPVITSVTAKDKYTVVVSVKPQENCTYEFMRSATRDGTYTLVATRDEPFLYDANENKDTDWFYRVRAVRGEFRSELSAPQQTGYQAGTVFGVPVLMYHEFVTQEDLDAGIAFDEYAVYASEFESDLQWLQKNGYTSITAAQLIDYLNGKGSMPKKPVLITIDDGKYGVYKRAWPLLKKYHMTASLALIGYEIDNATNAPDARSKSEAPYCTWQELAEMEASGEIEMVSHTDKQHYFSHDGRCGASTKDGDTLADFLPIAQKDYSDTARSFRQYFNKQPLVMAYPYSKRTELSDEAWLKSGFQLLFAGDSEKVSISMTNYFVREAGLNRKSAVIRRVARMTGEPFTDYIEQ
ncbi:MAG: polysaccharide deacetylase family protein [Ruminococcus sp.]|nr:polysaccharide deacetylase family protein [Ruminococcus sp.]